MKLNYYLSLAALIPAAILFVRIYQLDHIEKEPRRLLGKLVLFGALAAVPAALAQLLLTRAAGAALGRSTVWYLLLDNFVIVACSEELAKLLPVRLAAWDHPAFDYRFDAVVYSVSSALGFAAVENILYVLQSDLRTAVSRAILSVPGHFFFAVSMGLLLSRAKQAECCGQLRRRRVLALLTLAVPTLLHGLWDFLLAAGSRWAVIAFYAFVAAFFITAVCAAPRGRTAGCKIWMPGKDAFSELSNKKQVDCVAVCLFSVYNWDRK